MQLHFFIITNKGKMLLLITEGYIVVNGKIYLIMVLTLEIKLIKFKP